MGSWITLLFALDGTLELLILAAIWWMTLCCAMLINTR